MSKSDESKSENKGKKIVVDIAKTLTSVVDQSESQSIINMEAENLIKNATAILDSFIPGISNIITAGIEEGIKEGITETKKSLENKDEKIKKLINQINLSVQDNNFDGVMTYVDELKAIDSDNANIFFGKGITKVYSAPNEAIDQFDIILNEKMNDKNKDVYLAALYWKAISFEVMGDKVEFKKCIEEGSKICENLIVKNPIDFNVLYWRIGYLRKSNSNLNDVTVKYVIIKYYDEAIGLLKEDIKIDKKTSSQLLRFLSSEAVFLRENRNYNDAINCCIFALVLSHRYNYYNTTSFWNEKALNHFEKGLNHSEKKQYELALECFEEVINKDPQKFLRHKIARGL